jgi:hypothetical protein
VAIALVQSAEGTSSLATTTAAFSVAPTSGNLIVLCFSASNINGTPDAGWTQSANMEQVGNNAGYIWWRASTGANSFPYTLAAADTSAWVLTEWSGVDAAPYDIAAGQVSTTGVASYTTPNLTPTAGNRLLLAAIGGSTAAADLSADFTLPLNSFTYLRGAGTSNITGDDQCVGVAYRLVAANGSTAYSTGLTYPSGAVLAGRTGLIISFKEAAAGGALNVTGAQTTLATAQTGTIARIGAVTGAQATLAATQTGTIARLGAVTGAQTTLAATTAGTIAVVPAGAASVDGAQTTQAALTAGTISLGAAPALNVNGAQTTLAVVTAGTIGDVTAGAGGGGGGAGGAPSRAYARRLRESVGRRRKFEEDREEAVKALTLERPPLVSSPSTVAQIAAVHEGPTEVFEQDDEEEELLLILFAA